MGFRDASRPPDHSDFADDRLRIRRLRPGADCPDGRITTHPDNKRGQSRRPERCRQRAAAGCEPAAHQDPADPARGDEGSLC
ncbi:hypothetical protein DBR10_08665, partial [Caulobacter sp. HMWF025]